MSPFVFKNIFYFYRMENDTHTIKGKTEINGKIYFYEVEPIQTGFKGKNNLFFTDNNGQEAAVLINKGASIEERITEVCKLRKWI